MQTGTIIALSVGGLAVVGVGGYLALSSIRKTATLAGQGLGLQQAAVALAPALTGVGKGIEGLGQGIGSGVAGLGSGIGGGVSKIGGGVGTAVGAIGSGAGKVVGGVGTVVGSVGNAANTLTSGVRAVGRGVGTVASDVRHEVGSAVGTAKKYANPVNVVKDVAGGAKSVISKLKFW